MTTPRSVAPSADESDQEDAGLQLSDQAVMAYEGLLSLIPEAGTSGWENILGQLAEAADVSQLDAPWRTGNLEQFENVPLVITEVRRMPSDFEGGLGWFLALTAAVKGTGERVTITTGSVSVVAQLAKAYQLGAIPLTVIPRAARRPTKAGYRPFHLEVVR